MIQVHCETLARLSTLIGNETPFNTVRFDDGKIIATDRRFAVVERLPVAFEGAYHLAITTALIEQCRMEAQFGSTITITPNPMLQWTSVVTTLGWTTTDNLGVYPQHPTAYDDWWERIVKPCLDAPVANGNMVAHADQLERLAETSPSGTIIFETPVNTARPMVVRDANSPDWVGFFYPRLDDGVYHAPATVPNWLRG